MKILWLVGKIPIYQVPGFQYYQKATLFKNKYFKHNLLKMFCQMLRVCVYLYNYYILDKYFGFISFASHAFPRLQACLRSFTQKLLDSPIHILQELEQGGFFVLPVILRITLDLHQDQVTQRPSICQLLSSYSVIKNTQHTGTLAFLKAVMNN